MGQAEDSAVNACVCGAHFLHEIKLARCHRQVCLASEQLRNLLNQLITSSSTATTQNESGTTYLLRDLSVSKRRPPLIRCWSHQRLGFVSLLWVSWLIFFLGFAGVFENRRLNPD
ncbi:hypothetical protein HID58_059026, partial [Brassica napus]